MQISLGLAVGAASSAPLWLPSNLGAKLKFWGREDVTLASGKVSQWTDKSGTGTVFNDNGSALIRPAYTASGGPGGRAFITSNGTSQYLAGPTALSGVATSTAYEMYIVARVNTIGTDDANFYNNDALVSDDIARFGITVRSTGPTMMVGNYDGTFDVATATFATGAWMRIRIRHESGTLGIKVNNGTEGTAASGATTPMTGAVSFFLAGAYGAIADADIAEAILCNAVLSAGERASIDAYHANYFGLTVA